MSRELMERLYAAYIGRDVEVVCSRQFCPSPGDFEYEKWEKLTGEVEKIIAGKAATQ